MKKLLLTITAVAAMGLFSTTANAEEKKCPMNPDDAACCSAKQMVDAGANVSMGKGGSAADNVAEGYGLGQRVPDFKLTDASGKEFSLADTKGKVTVLVFYNQSCPYVKEMWDRLDEFTKTYAAKDVPVVAIDPGENNDPKDVAEHASSKAYPILLNRTSDLAVNFKATRTPEVFILNKDGVVSYHGMFDNGEKGGAEGARVSYAQQAVDALLAGKEPEVRETKAFGCTIKFAKAATEKKETTGG